MSDGFSLDAVSGGRIECGSFDREVGACVATGSGVIVPPVFSDFCGKQWESDFPLLLARYYDAVAGVGRARLHGCFASGGGVFYDRSVVCAGVGDAGECCRRVADVVERNDSVGRSGNGSGESDTASVRGSESGEGGDTGGNGAEFDVCDVVVKGKHYEKNKARRLRNKSLKTAGKSTLQASLEARWEAENTLAVEQAKRKLELLKSRDLDAEKRMQRVQIMRTTEAAKVQTERAYATLKRTGNVPGFAETVVASDSGLGSSPGRSDGTCISPDSSVSQQEIRAMMKENEDLKLTLKRIERDNPALVAHHMEGHGVKTAFTLDSDGMCPVDEPGCMGIDGKYHLDSYERNPKFYKDRFRAEEATERYFNRE